MSILTGNQGSVTIATITATWAADSYSWALERLEHQTTEVTPMPSVNGPKYAVSSLKYAQGTIRFRLDSSKTAPLPSTASGTVTLKLNAAGTGSYVIPALLFNIQCLGQSPGGEAFNFSANFKYHTDNDTAISVT